MKGSGADDGGKWDYLFKIILVGDAAVGKTNLITRYTTKAFSIDSKPTLGVDFSNATLTKDGKVIRVQIWDTSGQEVYKSITKSHFKGAHGALVVYDISKRESFEHALNWIADIKEAAELSPAIMMIGNKCDLEGRREVSRDEAFHFAKQKGMLRSTISRIGTALMETSALDMTNVEIAFKVMIDGRLPPIGTLGIEIYKRASRKPTGMAEDDARKVTKSSRLTDKGEEAKPGRRGCC